jgi:peptidoglycan/xylan/chitin deacetylase (PgdA/CDA1 family)
MTCSMARRLGYGLAGARFYAPGGPKTVALTFDDRPGRCTAAILAILARYRVPATFFTVGVNMRIRPSLVRAEVRGGYTMGSHTWNHPDMAVLSAARQAVGMDQVHLARRRGDGLAALTFGPPRRDFGL